MVALLLIKPPFEVASKISSMLMFLAWALLETGFLKKHQDRNLLVHIMRMNTPRVALASTGPHWKTSPLQMFVITWCSRSFVRPFLGKHWKLTPLLPTGWSLRRVPLGRSKGLQAQHTHPLSCPGSPCDSRTLFSRGL